MDATAFNRHVQGFGVRVEAEALRFQNQLTTEIRDEAALRTPVDEGTLKEAWTLEKAKRLGDSSHVRNGLPYAQVVEFGGYPNPPKGGEGKTEGGFSKQAPQGMLRPAVTAVLNRYGG
jgi:hypothetical protein